MDIHLHNQLIPLHQNLTQLRHKRALLHSLVNSARINNYSVTSRLCKYICTQNLKLDSENLKEGCPK